MEFRYSYEYQLFYYYLVFNKKNKIINTHTTISIQKPKLIG